MTKITDLPDFDRPREKLHERGPEALSDTELIAVILGSGIKGKHVLRVADAVVKKIDRHYRQLDVKMLTAIEGIGFAKACQIVASVEFARRRLLRDVVIIETAEDVLPLVTHIADKKQEHFICLTLNGANEVIRSRVITVGLLNTTQVHPREVFADAIADRAAAVMLVHNHPSGLLQPSSDDLALTRQLVKAGTILGISVLDHIIISKKGFLSLKEEDYIQ